MVEKRLTDGRRIAQFLASEITGHGDALAALSVTDADPDVEPTPDGTFAYAIDRDGDRVASVFVQPDRARSSSTRSTSLPTPPGRRDSASGRRRSSRHELWCSSRTARR